MNTAQCLCGVGNVNVNELYIKRGRYYLLRVFQEALSCRAGGGEGVVRREIKSIQYFTKSVDEPVIMYSGSSSVPRVERWSSWPEG